MKGFFEEFKKFVMRGNIFDLAIGIVIGTAFNAVVASFVSDIITPPLGLLLGRIDFTKWALNLGGEVNIKYGLFIQAIISFLITAFALFLIIRFKGRLERLAKNDPPPPPPAPSEKTPELVVLEEIRDSLKNRPSVTST
jgi:large conductance mechanosensitive channel